MVYHFFLQNLLCKRLSLQGVEFETDVFYHKKKKMYQKLIESFLFNKGIL